MAHDSIVVFSIVIICHYKSNPLLNWIHQLVLQGLTIPFGLVITSHDKPTCIIGHFWGQRWISLTTDQMYEVLMLTSNSLLIWT